MTTVLVAGALANKPGNGGEAWVRMSWAAGLARLGFDVFFVEQIAAAACADGEGHRAPFGASVNRDWFRQVTADFGLTGRSALICEDGEETEGLTLAQIGDIADDADLLVNISGNLRHPAVLSRPRIRAYVDIDPGFTQLWHAKGDPGAGLAGHTHHYTIGENIGTDGCPIPVSGIHWRPIRQPVTVEDWSGTVATRPATFSTIATWRNPFGPVEHEGIRYSLKVHQFRRFVELPQQSTADFELALDIQPGDQADLDLLLSRGWRIVAPEAVAGDPGRFRSYVQSSGAEFSVAQGLYVETGCGWFSDRSTRYLAAGRPVLVQDTGFTRAIPAGLGLVAFTSMEEAVAGAAAITADYEAHSAAAPAVAERYFGADRVLGRMADELGVGR